MSKSIILVCVHKPDILFSNEIYVPIHVGKEISNYNLDYIGDNTGINISHKNPYYCELTAQYWAWKNVNKSFIGLAHYRRYFEKIIDDNYAEKILTKYDVILSKPITRPFPIIEKIIAALSFEETYIFFNTIIELFPEYRKTLIDYFYNNNKDIAYNMFFCKKELFDEFCEWQFKILSECEKYFKTPNYTRQKRIYGYLGEYLLPLFFIHNKKKIKYDNIIPLLDKNNKTNVIDLKEIKQRIVNSVLFKINNRRKINKFMFPDAVLVGLKMDNILNSNKL